MRIRRYYVTVVDQTGKERPDVRGVEWKRHRDGSWRLASLDCDINVGAIAGVSLRDGTHFHLHCARWREVSSSHAVKLWPQDLPSDLRAVVTAP